MDAIRLRQGDRLTPPSPLDLSGKDPSLNERFYVLVGLGCLYSVANARDMPVSRKTRPTG